MKKAVVLALVLAAAPLRGAVDSPLSKGLREMVDQLCRGYAQKSVGSGSESLAVLSFSSSKELTKTKAGFAVSELLTHFFVQRPKFVVVERNLLNKVEEEQKFQAMSADTATAVKIGKLIGAQLLVLGSVEKMGGGYQTNARLVRTETGEILATSFQEYPAKVFEEEARPYLNLVPERQAIGFYTAYQFRPKAKAGESVTKGDSGWRRDVTPRDFETNFIGGGVRYFPGEHLVIDLGFLATASHQTVLTFHSTWSSGWDRIDHQSQRPGYLLRAFLGWSQHLSKRWRCEAGAGVTKYHLVVEGGGSEFNVDMGSTSPLLRASLEYRIQERLGIGVAINQDLAPLEGKYAVGGTAFRVSGFSVEPSLALYF